MNLEFIILYNGSAFGYYRTCKLIGLYENTLGNESLHYVQKLDIGDKQQLKKQYPNTSIRTIDDTRIPLYIRNKIKNNMEALLKSWSDAEMVEFAAFSKIQNQMEVYDAQRILDLFKMKKGKQIKPDELPKFPEKGSIGFLNLRSHYEHLLDD